MGDSVRVLSGSSISFKRPLWQSQKKICPGFPGLIKPEPFNPSMMPTRPMRVAVRYLFRTGSAYFDDFDIEGQGFTGHRRDSFRLA